MVSFPSQSLLITQTVDAIDPTLIKLLKVDNSFSLALKAMIFNA